MLTILKKSAFVLTISAISIVGFAVINKKLHPHNFLESYSQEGEDMVIRRLVGKKKEGFFVDIGAYHPIKLSNTYHFYKRGWRGINIDAMPGSMKPFLKLRPRDINLEIAVGSYEGTINYYIFKEQAFNTCDPVRAEGYLAVKPVPMRPLSAILKEYVPAGQTIDFFNIDVEGLDLEVLKSNDWNQFAPHYILVESVLTGSIEEALQTGIAIFLKNKGYQLVAKTKNTLCFELSTH